MQGTRLANSLYTISPHPIDSLMLPICQGSEWVKANPWKKNLNHNI
jgi:hypothetical protein